jgi:hypothetical protein
MPKRTACQREQRIIRRCENKTRAVGPYRPVVAKICMLQFAFITAFVGHQKYHKYVSQNRKHLWLKLVASMTARFAFEEGLIDADDVYSEFENEVEDIEDLEELHEIFGPSIPDNVLRRWEQSQKRKETELEVLGNDCKRRRRQKLIREKKLNEKIVDALRAVCNNGRLMPVTVRTGILQCLGEDHRALPF